MDTSNLSKKKKKISPKSSHTQEFQKCAKLQAATRNTLKLSLWLFTCMSTAAGIYSIEKKKLAHASPRLVPSLSAEECGRSDPKIRRPWEKVPTYLSTCCRCCMASVCVCVCVICVCAGFPSSNFFFFTFRSSTMPFRVIFTLPAFAALARDCSLARLTRLYGTLCLLTFFSLLFLYFCRSWRRWTLLRKWRKVRLFS